MRQATAAILLLTAGCVGALKSEYPERRLYTLSAERSGAAGTTAKDAVLRVRRFTGSKLAEGSELVTRKAESEYESDFYNQFFAPPAVQLTEQTHRWLGASGLFSAVVGTGSSIPETHVLEGNLIALYDDRTTSKSSAVLEIQFMLVRVSSEPTAVLLQKTYRETVPTSESGPEALVRAWNAALGKVLTAFEADLAKIDRSAKKP